MNKILFTNEFKKEIKLAKKRGKDVKKLIRVVEMLENDDNLPDKYRNHKLKGEFKNRWELHIDPDWLLIYKKGIVKSLWKERDLMLIYSNNLTRDCDLIFSQAL